MKKIYFCLLSLTFFAAAAQDRSYGNAASHAANQQQNYSVSRTLEACNAVVINDTEEENGVFISGVSGQKAAADIPIAADQQITITGVKVTLASMFEPEFVNLRFYDNILSTPEDPEDPTVYFIPGATLFDVATTIESFEEIGYEPMHQFVIRRITLTLPQPIVLYGNQVADRYWMGVLSNANAWATTAHYETGDGVIGESVAMGSNNFQWFQLGNIEAQYELTAECSLLGVAQFSNANQLAVTPNPASDFLAISLASGKSVEKAEIYTVSGQKVFEINSGFDHINIAALSNGLYILKTHTNENQNYTTKFVKLN